MKTDHPEAYDLATTFLAETIDLIGPVKTIADLIKRARAVTSDRVQTSILSIAVADVFAAHWESRSH